MNIYVFSLIFVLTEAKSFDDKQGTKLLLVSGKGNGFDYFKASEVIDLETDIGDDCNGWTESPIEISSGTGAVFSIDSGEGTEDIQALLVCGGIQTTAVTSNECYILDKYSSRLFATMSKKRGFAASLKESTDAGRNYLWVTGGTEYNDIFSSTEYILKNGESVEGPKLPIGLAAHTVVGINSTLSMFIGGFITLGTSTDLTYYYDNYNQVWFDGPKLNFARYLHGSGIVTDLITRERLLIVTGGLSYDDDYIGQDYRSTEILIDGTWVLGPNLPRAIGGHSMLEYGDSLLLIGGAVNYSSIIDAEISNSIFSLTCEARVCFWTELSQKLSIGRLGMVTAIIPDSMTNC